MSEQRRLPGTLADRILDLQFIMDCGDLDEVKLGELLAAYSEAINHFYELKDERFKFYQQKIKKLFANMQVKKLLGESPSNPNLKKKQEIIVENKRISRKVEEASEAATYQAKTLIENFESSKFKTAQRITSELSSQKENIMQRIQARSSSKMKHKESSITQQARRRMEIMEMLNSRTR